MADPGVLQLIAAKEQELRVQLVAARAQADALVREARSEAAAFLAAEEASAARDAQEWLDQELDRARHEAERLVSAAGEALRRPEGVGRSHDAAVQRVLDEILLRPGRARS